MNLQENVIREFEEAVRNARGECRTDIGSFPSPPTPPSYSPPYKREADGPSYSPGSPYIGEDETLMCGSYSWSVPSDPDAGSPGSFSVPSARVNRTKVELDPRSYLIH